jgi:hypothetical protein
MAMIASMWLSFLLLSFALATAAKAQGIADAIPPACRQLVLVTAPVWDSPRGVLRRYERERTGTRWREIGEARDVLLGERGLAWGLGLHEVPQDAARRKHEGDRRAPAGVFVLPAAFGRPTVKQLAIERFPYRQLAPGTAAVDDPASRFYNHLVWPGQIPVPDWKSSEHMAEVADYELGVAVSHNPQDIPGAGSCIFIHQWRGERTGTAGCTVLRAPHLLELVRWLDADKHPVLIQLPRRELPAGFP